MYLGRAVVAERDFRGGGLGLVRTTDGGSSWTSLTGSNTYSTVVFDPSTPETLYVFGSFTISKSTDNGGTLVHYRPSPARPLSYAGARSTPCRRSLRRHHRRHLPKHRRRRHLEPETCRSNIRLLVADPNSSAVYASLSGYGIVKSTDGFATASPIGPNEPPCNSSWWPARTFLKSRSHSTDVFAVKLDDERQCRLRHLFRRQRQRCSRCARR